MDRLNNNEVDCIFYLSQKNDNFHSFYTDGANLNAFLDLLSAELQKGGGRHTEK